LPEEPISLASWNAVSNNGSPILRNIDEALLNRDPQTNQLVGELATSWKLLDANTWQFQLRKGVKFQDGSTFDAKAAAYSLNYELDPKKAYAVRVVMATDIHANAVGTYTLNLTTDKPDPILPNRMYFIAISSAKQLMTDPKSYGSVPIGTGPYKFVSWTRGQSIQVTANDAWWGRKDKAAANGQNTDITSATFVFRSNPRVATSLVQTGEADFARWVTKDQCQTAPKCVSATDEETVLLRLDTMNPVLKDKRIREAIALAVDKNAIMKDILGGGTTASQLAGSWSSGTDPQLKPYPYDLARAKQLVADAKASGVPVGTTPLHVTYRAGFIINANEIAQLLQASFKQIGLNVDARGYDTGQYESQFTMAEDKIPASRGWIALQSHSDNLSDYSDDIAGYLACSGANSAFCDPTADSMLATLLPLTGQARVQALQKASDYIYSQYPVIPIGQDEFNYPMSKNINWTPRVDGLILLKEFAIQ